MVDLAGATDASVERLRHAVVPLQGGGIEQVSARFREGETALAVPKIDGLDESLVSEMMDCARVDFELSFGHYSESPDGGQCAAVIAIQLVYTVAIDHQLAPLAARQVEVLHERVARIVIIPVALVVHARPFVAAIPIAVFARVIPSSVRHRPSLRG